MTPHQNMIFTHFADPSVQNQKYVGQVFGLVVFHLDTGKHEMSMSTLHAMHTQNISCNQ